MATIGNAPVFPTESVLPGNLQVTGNATISGTTNSVGALTENSNEVLNVTNTTFFSADIWRLSANFTITTFATDYDLIANWERVDDNGAGYLGTGMTESSGVFTFPSTGIWLINFGAGFNASTTVDWAAMMLRVTTDNSNYNNNVTENYCSFNSGDFESMAASYIVDVTDTSNVKVKFETRASDNGTVLRGQTDESQTYAVFVRLGST